jgi:hypothetical protein
MTKLLVTAAAIAFVAAWTAQAEAFSIGVNQTNAAGAAAVSGGNLAGASAGQSNSASAVIFHNGSASAGGSFGATGNASATLSVPNVCVTCSATSSANGTSTTTAVRN